MDGLPFLPGNNFSFIRPSYHRSHTLGFKNGYVVQKKPDLVVGGTPLQQNQVHELDVDSYNPQLYYGRAKQEAPEPFVPAFVALDKKVLKFKGWFKETVHESPVESYRVRLVNVFYHLEDDTISVIEPVVDNSGLPQGKLIKRQRIPKNESGETYIWKDLNNGKNISCFGRIFHLYECDEWTAEFLRSEGIDVNEAESYPEDPYIVRRIQKEQSMYKGGPMDSPTANDKLRRFLEMDGKVLRFDCLWDTRNKGQGERRKFIMHFFLVDDTIEVREVHTKNDGHDPFPVLISRRKIPKNPSSVDPNFPSIVLEYSEKELGEFYTPKDFAIGRTVLLYNRPFLICDCDDFTKAFYWKNYGLSDFTPANTEAVRNSRGVYEGYGTIEDSLRSCEQLVPEPPKKDFIKMMEYDKTVLRYEAIMDTINPENKSRRFIISYRLADDMMSIYEPKVKNSGMAGGKFLERTRVAKPGSSVDKPVYYGPSDFQLGSVVDIFKTRFIITGADEFTVKFMQSRPDQFANSFVESFRNSLKISPQ